MAYKLGSLFDGSGGFPLAGSLCGIEPVWAAEIEPYPIAVTLSRFPYMKHLGDVSKVNGGEIEPVDIITFGSPCQDLSVAGKRAGLKHEANGDEETTRSGLFMEAVRIIKEMREATNGEYPSFALWENVPGAFSSNKGEDFRFVCEELIKIVEPAAVMPAVPKNGWPYADSYVGDGWSLAYRVFDAQFWGVPQRRRRIHLVVDFRGDCARQVSFERKGLRGYLAEIGTKGEAVARDVKSCFRAATCKGEHFDGGLDAVGFDVYNMAVTGDVTKTLNAAASDADHIPCVMEPITLEPGIAAREGGHIYVGICGTLCTNMGDNQMAVAHKMIDENILDDQGGSQISVRTDGKSPTLRAEMHGNVPCVVEAMGFDMYNQQSTDVASEEQLVVFDKEVYQSGKNASGGAYIAEDGPAPCLRATGHPPGVCVQYIVRRLMPVECARLQGFPDKWGDINEWKAFTQEEFRFWHDVRNTHAAINGKATKEYTMPQILTWYNKLHTDSAEYKMWGNGIALPPALYIMQGMVEALKTTDIDSWML